MRLEARLKLGYYPLPDAEAERLRKYLVFPESHCSALDPCAGTGAALATLTCDSTALRYAIELDAHRAYEARKLARAVIQGSVFNCHAAVESFSLLYLNPPYDFEVGEGKNQRMEKLFLEQCYRWLKPGGVLVIVAPFDRIYECRSVLTPHFRDKAIYRLTDPDSVRYKQAVLFGVRRTRREREQLTDMAAQRANYKLADLVRQYQEIPPLSETPDRLLPVPESKPATLEHKGLPLDQIEDLMATSPASLQARRVTHAEPVKFAGRPLTPLHGGHVGLLCTSGLLNGVFGQGADRHVAYWEAVKVSDRSEQEEDDGSIVIREKERFSQRLTALYANGRFLLLSEHSGGKENSDAECTPANGKADVGPPDGDE